MRRLKFKLWDKIGEEWLSDYSISSYDEVLDLHEELNCEQEDTVLVQYTGLKDKHGKEIYEGDIVTDGEYVGKVLFHDRWYEVGMHSGKLAWCIFNKKTGKYITLGECDDEETWEIISNVHEDPEILTDKDERNKTKNQRKKS